MKILFLKASLAFDENAKKGDVPINPACGKEWDSRFLLLSPQPLSPEVVKCVRLYAARTPKWCWYAAFLVYYGTLSGKLFHTGKQSNSFLHTTLFLPAIILPLHGIAVKKCFVQSVFLIGATVVHTAFSRRNTKLLVKYSGCRRWAPKISIISIISDIQHRAFSSDTGEIFIGVKSLIPISDQSQYRYLSLF